MEGQKIVTKTKAKIDVIYLAFIPHSTYMAIKQNITYILPHITRVIELWLGLDKSFNRASVLCNQIPGNVIN